MPKRHHIPTYKLQNYFSTVLKFSGIVAVSVSSFVGISYFIQYQRALHYVVDENREIRIDCDPRARKASFPSEYTPAARIKSRELVNCDSTGSGVCMVEKVLIETNSHAGTHADQPKHFVENPPFQFFPDEYYNGNVLLIDLTPYLSKEDPRIDSDLLEYAFNEIESMKMFQTEAPWISTVVNQMKNPNNVHRVLLKTWPGEHREDIQLDDPNAYVPYFTPAGASYLLQRFPELRLIGVDSISVDHPSASPILDHSHGVFWRNQVAILENLRLDKVDRSIQAGKIRTFFNPYQDFEDARGCIVTYTPAVDPMEKLSRGRRFDYVVKNKEFKELSQQHDKL